MATRAPLREAHCREQYDHRIQRRSPTSTFSRDLYTARSEETALFNASRAQQQGGGVRSPELPGINGKAVQILLVLLPAPRSMVWKL